MLQRHGVSRLPELEGDKPDKRKFKPIRSAISTSTSPRSTLRRGKLYLFVAIDRTSKFAFAELDEKADRSSAARFLEAAIAAMPYRLHTVLTDNGIQFTDLPETAMAGLPATACTASTKSVEPTTSSTA